MSPISSDETVLKPSTRHPCGVRVLVVDDDEELADAIAVGLRRESMAVDVALDGPSGFDRALTNDYDVIVLDRDLLMIGDADIVRPEHVVELFRLLGGGVPGDVMPLPPAQLAVLPGTNHVDILDRVEWLSSMIVAFLTRPPEV